MKGEVEGDRELRKRNTWVRQKEHRQRLGTLRDDQRGFGREIVGLRYRWNVPVETYVALLSQHCRFMGAVGFHSSSSSVCPIKSSGGLTRCSVAYSCRPRCFPFDLNQARRVNCMASTIPVQEMKEEGQLRLTGDSFIRPHLCKLSPYHPILPFEVILLQPS
ncbi:hypothetical protein RHMOL_Rhmol09G0108400 [Rhododendron molle]|uniref:Uncharacterized protein n=1 Tax=Rhododendron molle TaxID=49168 RepID=A0ACC0MBT9_RHOML|nr:hypothetical protein RHMOL_Rhmol09G0108400 [Rhododendron molle]